MERGHRLRERYRLIDQIGSGGMAVVWRGYDEVLQRGVAIKLIAPWAASDAATRHRLQAEARAAASLSYPHIASVFDYGEVGRGRRCPPMPFVVMELVPGESMSHRLNGQGALPWPEAARTCAQVAAALAFAHEHGVVHRDVTPGNVMVAESGAKVVDFGISAMVGEHERGMQGRVMGTPAYVAPERLDTSEVDTPVDVYGVGVLLYRSLSGRLPWAAQTVTEMLRARRESDPCPLWGLPGVPDELIELCHRCIDRHPRQRPSSLDVAYTLAGSVGLSLPAPTRAPVAIGAPFSPVRERVLAGCAHTGQARAPGLEASKPSHSMRSCPDPTRPQAMRPGLAAASAPLPGRLERTLVGPPPRIRPRARPILVALGVLLLGAVGAMAFAPGSADRSVPVVDSEASVGPAPACPAGTRAAAGAECAPVVPASGTSGQTDRSRAGEDGEDRRGRGEHAGSAAPANRRGGHEDQNNVRGRGRGSDRGGSQSGRA